MGFTYRKSFKAGPIRITASKSGLSASADVKGARVTKRADGRVQTTLSVPSTGLRYTKTAKPKKQPADGSGRRRVKDQGAGQVGTPASASTPPVEQAVQASGSAQPIAAVVQPAQQVVGRPPVINRRPEVLPSQPGTVLPPPPPPGSAPMHFKGYLAAVTLYPDRIQIDRTRVGRINGSQSAVIAWQHLVGVDFLDPTRMINGHIHFATAADPRGLTASGQGDRMAAAARNPHAVMFTWQQRATYQRLRDLLMTAAACSPGLARQAGSSPSVADELAKLHALHQQGALTAAEFEQAKGRLLGPHA